MRIFLLSTSMGMGGADQQILILARAMQGRGHEVRIVSLTPLGPMGLEAQRDGIPTESLELQRNVSDLPRLRRLVHMLRAWKPDVLHSHMVHANLLARAVRPLSRMPALVSTIHSSNDGGRLRMAAYRLTSGMVNRFTIISRLAAARYVAIGAVPADRLTVVPNAVDTDRFTQVPGARAAIRLELGLGEEFVWLAVGRFQEAKDSPTMIAAFARLAVARPDSRLLLVGKGALQGEVEELVREAGLKERVRFLGVRRDVPELMSAADGYLLSSAWEGMPVVLLEASAIGLPIVATRVGGVAEVVEDGSSGFLVPPRDASALARAMERLEALSPAERRAMGERGRALVERQYGTARVMDMWERIYLELAPVSRVASAAQR
ncbi:MAG: glycosyltransferase [Gemmatimonadota bacterium]|nr:glycosyltransferase [Gemmatimonadota bacterium]